MPPKRTTKRVNGKKNPGDRIASNRGALPTAPRSRVAFTFPVLRDLVFLVCEREPWRAEHGQVIDAWKDIANMLNDRFKLQPPAKDSTVRNKITALRKVHEQGADPESLRLKLSSEQQIVIASALDTLSHKLRTWETEKANTNQARNQHLEQQTAAGLRVREKALTRLSQRRSNGPETPPNLPENPRVSDPTQRRSSSAPPTSRSARSIPAVITRITSAINLAEGRRTQRLEVLQLELIQATRDGVVASMRSAAALERIADAMDILCKKLHIPESECEQA
ncbi:hypothetical protein RSAG8_12861, partial [Rhizoctonia solani AG-8 WAC10335]